MRHPRGKVEEALGMIRGGAKCADAAARLGVPYHTVRSWARKAGLGCPGRGGWPRKPLPDSPHPMSGPRAGQVLEMLREGKSIVQVAGELGVERRSVVHYLYEARHGRRQKWRRRPPTPSELMAASYVRLVGAALLSELRKAFGPGVEAWQLERLGLRAWRPAGTLNYSVYELFKGISHRDRVIYKDRESLARFLRSRVRETAPRGVVTRVING